MKTNEINIRDPFLLKHEGKYYLYGTRSETCWGIADGLDAYVSDDLEAWSGPIEIFHGDGSFWADRCYWAPECYFYKDRFYLFSTFASEKQLSGTAVLVSDSPLGPFMPWSDGPLNPHDWECLDGTLYIDEEGIPYMAFSRSLKQEPKAGMYYVRLSEDLKTAVTEPKLMFYAADTPWAKPFPKAREEFKLTEDGYFSDGPFFYRSQSSKLLLLWSSWGDGGYSMGIAHSDNGGIDGRWVQEETALYGNDGGHGMIFKLENDELLMALHYPNEKYAERVKFIKVEDTGKTLKNV